MRTLPFHVRGGDRGEEEDYSSEEDDIRHKDEEASRRREEEECRRRRREEEEELRERREVQQEKLKVLGTYKESVELMGYLEKLERIMRECKITRTIVYQDCGCDRSWR